MNIIIERPEPEFTCHDCNGACCQAGTVLRMTEAEALVLKTHGGDVEKMPEEEIIKMLRHSIPGLPADNYWRRAQDSWHRLQSDCPFLSEPLDEGCNMRKCEIHTESYRPKVCGQFVVGSVACEGLRKANYLDALITTSSLEE